MKSSKKKSIYNCRNKCLRKLTKKFLKNNYIIYKKNIFPKEIYDEIVKLTNNYKSKLKRDKYNKNRYGCYVPKNSKLYSIIYSKKFKSILEKIVNEKLDYSDFPIEYRIYPNKSKGMSWHSDSLLYNEPQYELVFTINNTSNSKTVWRDKNNENFIKTEPNSLIIVRANAAEHKVTPNKFGERNILKFIYAKKKSSINKNLLKYEKQRYSKDQ